MKFASHLFVLSTLFSTSLLAIEKMPIEYSSTPAFIAFNAEDKQEYQKMTEVFQNHEQEQTILTLKKTILDQKQDYEKRIAYLEKELKKSQIVLYEKIKIFEQAKSDQERKHKLEKIAQTKEMMKYQRELEKVRPNRESKEFLMAQADLALQMRKSQEQMAINSKEPYATLDNFKTMETTNSPKRLPASVEK